MNLRISNIIFIVLVAAFSQNVFAAMMPLGSSLQGRTERHVSQADRNQCSDDSLSNTLNVIKDCRSLMAEADLDRTLPDTQEHFVLTSGVRSLDMCVFALLSLGFIQYGGSFRRSIQSSVPEWYHAGAPERIGNSLVLDFRCDCPVKCVYFVQPIIEAELVLNLYPQGGWRGLLSKSQYSPEQPLTRGPPILDVV